MKSPNFSFLERHGPLLVGLAVRAERYVFEDPNTSILKLRQFAEALAFQMAARLGYGDYTEATFVQLLRILQDEAVVTAQVADLFHMLRKVGNRAAHEHTGSQRQALHMLQVAWKLAVWFHRAFGQDAEFKPTPFLPPPEPQGAEQALIDELEQLKVELSEAKQVAIKAQESAQAYQQLAVELGSKEQEAAQMKSAEAAEKTQLLELQSNAGLQTKKAKFKLITKANQLGEDLDLNEAETRKLIDEKLREAGWEADTLVLRHSKGARPAKGRNLAIAEWPTEYGPADYVLFIGLQPVGVVEAKRKNKNAYSFIEQSKRYSKGFVLLPEFIINGQWGEYRVPFLFSTNGRPYLKQIEMESGIWFLDARESTNHPRALEGWFSPDGLSDLLSRDKQKAAEQLSNEDISPVLYRDYQRDAIKAVEQTLFEGKREVLVAMATGTGKTRTCIGLIHRLLKSEWCKRVLFVVDRNALGTQAADRMKELPIEGDLKLTDIYDVKELSATIPEDDTRLQIATIQGLMRKLLYSEEGADALNIETYDCIIVDECHRGYNLDRELSDAELTFRSELDYISKYRRVLEHFDAVKIGLTATPAIHTTEIFGMPVYQYSYRQAVIDGWLADHEPPLQIVTKLAEDGITWKKGDEISVYHPKAIKLEQVIAEDDVNVEIEQFNKRVVTESFNRVVCAELAKQIDPTLPGKTLVFCANDRHADLVVKLIKEELAKYYGSVEDDAVMKITGAADRPDQLILRYRNERLPNIAVTVDLLSTGIDVHQITNIVFLRRIRSLILYEQMLGRGTRLCDDLYGKGKHKETFRIFDAVRLYEALDEYSSMKPVVANPSFTIAQLVEELSSLKDLTAREEVKIQLVAKLQRKKRALSGENLDAFEVLANLLPETLIKLVKESDADTVCAWFKEHAAVPEFLDNLSATQDGRLLISKHEDILVSAEYGYGDGRKPKDYLEAFHNYITDNVDKVEALKIVLTRPRDLTRDQLKELKVKLGIDGYRETALRTAIRESTNADFAASIIGYIRHAASGAALLPYSERVSRAMKIILESRAWTQPQRRWLERIGEQLMTEPALDKTSLDLGQFRLEGGFKRLDRVFNTELEVILGDIREELWREPA